MHHLGRSSAPLLSIALVGLLAGTGLGRGFEDTIIREMKTKNIAGLSAVIIKNRQVVWAKGYGWADVRAQKAVTTDTLFMTASVCKTVTGTALMHAWENGTFGLDENINNYLSFPVENPNHPHDRITFRQVLTHTSSIRDNWDLLDPFYVPGDWPTTLAYWLENYLARGGRWYVVTNYPGHLPVAENWYGWAPGTQWSYSNQGFALAGHLVEATTGANFEDYTEQHLFSPLGMTKTEWHMADLRADEVAKPYKWVPFLDTWKPYGELGTHYGYPDFPAGTLRTTPTELAQFLIMHMNDGMYEGMPIISPATAAEMRRVQYPMLDSTQALAFFYRYYDDELCIGHDGGDPGIATEMWWRLSDDAGVIVFANTSAGLNTIVKALFKEASNY